MDQGQFNPSVYQGMDPMEVNWAQLAQQWMINARPPLPPPPPPRPPYPQSFPPRPYPPHVYDGGAGAPPYQNPCFPYGPVPLSSQRFPIPPAPPRQSLGFFDNSYTYYGAAPPRFPPRMMPPLPPQRMPFMHPPAPSQLPQHSMGFFPAPVAQRPSRPPFVANTTHFRHPLPCPTQGSSAATFDEYQAYYDSSLEEREQDESKPKPKEAPAEAEEAEGTGAMSHWLTGDINPGEMVPSPASQLSEWTMAELCWQSMPSASHQSLLDMPYMDQQTRKRLPAWILEGMEKAEREKRKKLERERKRESLQQQDRKKELGDEEEESDANEEEGGSNGKTSPTPAVQSIDASDRKLESGTAPENEESVSGTSFHQKWGSTRAIQLATIRKLMTSILLDTTDGQIARLAKEALTKRKAETAATPKILARSSALAAISALGDDDDDSEDEDEEEDGHSREKGTHNPSTDFKAPKPPSAQRPSNVLRTRLGSGEITSSASIPEGDEHHPTTRHGNNGPKASSRRNAESNRR